MEEKEKLEKQDMPHEASEDIETSKADEAKTEKGARPFWKIGVLLILAIAIGVVVIMKREQRDGASGAVEQVFSTETVLATVNGRQITLRELENIFNRMPEEYRSEFVHQRHELLEQSIMRLLLLDEAQRRGIERTEAYAKATKDKGPDNLQRDDLLVSLLIKEDILKKVEVSEEDVRRFYDEHKDQIPGSPTFEEARNMILPSVKEQKQYEAVEGFIAGLRNKATVSRNDEWVDAQKKVLADNPLDRALASGKPILADFGQATCIPCKMMKPILDGLAEELKGKVHVLIIDTGEYGPLARRVKIRVIPTQIFYDASAKELFRHEGFMSKEDILKKWQELGFNFNKGTEK